MAKTKMMCPFSNKLCEECALYRGRHYYLCFSKKYRGHLDDPGEEIKLDSRRGSLTGSNSEFEMPSVIPANTKDPFITGPLRF